MFSWRLRTKDNVAAEAPPPATVVPGLDVTHFSVDHPEQYPVATATQYQAPSKVGGDRDGVSRRLAHRARGHLGLGSRGRYSRAPRRHGEERPSCYCAFAATTYRAAMTLTEKPSPTSFWPESNSIAPSFCMSTVRSLQQDLEVAQDTEDDAKTTLDTTTEHLRLLGNDPEHPNGIVDITSPISGEITDQEVVNGSTMQSYSANPFTISDLSTVWIVCDVYENDIATLRSRRTGRRSPECFSGQDSEGHGQQHRRDSRSHHSHRQGPH